MIKNSTRILLVNAVNPAVEVETRYPNLGLGYLAASVRKHIPDEIITFFIADDNIKKIVAEFKPHLVGISSVSQNYNIALNYSRYFETQNIPFIIGGVHITSLPKTLPKSAIAACLGESEMTFVELVKLFIEGGFSPEKLKQIQGIAFWDGQILIETESRRLMEMDTIPPPARDLLNIRSHTYMFTSRGCPYRCTFCSSSRFWDKLRFFSAEYVVDEIEFLYQNHDVSMISFFDDLFAANRKRLKRIIRSLKNRQLLGKIKYTCSCRANVVDKELASLFSEMGIVSVGLGLESGDENILQYLKGESIHVRDNIRAVNVLKDAGIAANASFIIGSPQETVPQIMNTYNFIKNSKLDLFDIYILTPYPGTPVWEYAKKCNLISEDIKDWSILDVNVYRSPNKAVILSECLSKDEVVAYYMKFRRLRFRRNIIKVIKHPMKRDLPRMAWELLKERIYHHLNY